MTPPIILHPDGVITTERLLLRPLTSADSDSVFTIRSDPQVLYWTDPDTREKSEEWLKARLECKTSMIYTVYLRPPEHELPASSSEGQQLQLIGMIGAGALPELGYTFLPSFWGKGYATEALRAWVDMYWRKYPEGYPALDEEKKGYLKATTGPGGDRSRAVLRKCGFEWWGEEEVTDERIGAKEKDMRVVLVEWRLQRPES